MGGRGEPRNLASWPAEFDKIFRGKLWALNIIAVILYTESVRDNSQL